jgi:hypothetical protein
MIMRVVSRHSLTKDKTSIFVSIFEANLTIIEDETMSTMSYAITSVGQESYSNRDEKRPGEAIIGEAYNEAKRILGVELGQDKCDLLFEGKYSIKDVLEKVHESKTRYETKQTSKVREWLKIFSSRVAYYGVILDVLVQHHPEYVSLAWGTMKFLFMVSMQHYLLGVKV